MISIEIVKSDVFKVRADAIVNPANRQASLLLGSHVNERIRKTGGREIAAERKAKGPMEPGEAVHTAGGRLPFRYVIHAAVLDMFDLNPLFLLKLKKRTGIETLKKAARNSIRTAEKLQIKSIVFTPMGAGIGGMPMKQCAEILLDQALRFSSEHPGHVLENITFAVKTEKDRRIFMGELEKLNTNF